MESPKPEKLVFKPNNDHSIDHFEKSPRSEIETNRPLKRQGTNNASPKVLPESPLTDSLVSSQTQQADDKFGSSENLGVVDNTSIFWEAKKIKIDDFSTDD